MKRKLISLLLTLVLCLNLAICAAATENDFVQDALNVMSESERVRLNEIATEIYQDTGVAVYYIYTLEEDLIGYDVFDMVFYQADYYVMLENEDSWHYFAGGRGEQLDTDTLRAAYDETETYAEGVEAYLAEASVQLIFIGGAPTDPAPTQSATVATDPTEYAPTEDVTTEGNLLIADEPGLLTEAELIALNTRLQQLSQKYNAEIRICILSSMEGNDIDEFLHYLYDNGDFGYGVNRDGVLLLVSMDPREYRILSNGFAGEAITSSDIDLIGDVIVPDLSDGNYAAAFNGFADQCEYYLDGYINGYPFDATTSLIIAVVVGLLTGLVVTSVLKGQLKSVHKKNEANAYVKPGTMQITQSGDFFMYRNVTRTERQQSSSSSGGSSGGGSSRSTGGGSF